MVKQVNSLIKAIFFDWFNTLACFDPPREELFGRAFQQFGIELALEALRRGILAADQHYFEENNRLPVKMRSAEEVTEVFAYYPKAILAEASIEAAPELSLKVLKVVQAEPDQPKTVLFDDVLSTMKGLKERSLTLGVVTNAERKILSQLGEVGLEDYLDFVVTSEEVGANKPEPPIFLAALDRAGVRPFEAVHVGDQYQLDVVGAMEVGINPVLIDRYDLFPELSDCPRILSLNELTQRY